MLNLSHCMEALLVETGIHGWLYDVNAFKVLQFQSVTLSGGQRKVPSMTKSDLIVTNIAISVHKSALLVNKCALSVQKKCPLSPKNDFFHKSALLVNKCAVSVQKKCPFSPKKCLFSPKKCPFSPNSAFFSVRCLVPFWRPGLEISGCTVHPEIWLCTQVSKAGCTPCTQYFQHSSRPIKLTVPTMIIII